MTTPSVRIADGLVRVCTPGGTCVLELDEADAMTLAAYLTSSVESLRAARRRMVRLAHCPACGEGAAVVDRTVPLSPVLGPHTHEGSRCPNVGVPVPWSAVYEEEVPQQ